MIRIWFFLFFLMGLHLNSFSQLSASASTSAVIIEPIGGSKSNELMIFRINPSEKSGEEPGNQDSPFFEVVSNESSYAITLSHSTEVVNETIANAKMKIDYFNYFPMQREIARDEKSNRFTVAAIFNSKLNTAPGYYSSPDPCLITVHFN